MLPAGKGLNLYSAKLTFPQLSSQTTDNGYLLSKQCFLKAPPPFFRWTILSGFLFAQPWSLWSFVPRKGQQLSCPCASKLQVSDDEPPSWYRHTPAPGVSLPAGRDRAPSSEPTPKILYLALELPSAETLLCAWPWIDAEIREEAIPGPSRAHHPSVGDSHLNADRDSSARTVRHHTPTQRASITG